MMLALGPELPNAKVALPLLGIMKNHDGSIGQLGQPAFEIVTDGFIGMQAVHVEEINGPILEAGETLVEGRSDELAVRIVSRYPGPQMFVHCAAVIGPSVRIPAPGVDPITERAGFEPLCGVAGGQETGA